MEKEIVVDNGHGIVELWLSQGSPTPVDTSPQFNLVQLRRELEKPQPLI